MLRISYMRSFICVWKNFTILRLSMNLSLDFLQWFLLVVFWIFLFHFSFQFVITMTPICHCDQSININLYYIIIKKKTRITTIVTDKL